MKLHTFAFELLALVSIFVKVLSLKSDKIIGDDTNLVTHLNPEEYAHHGTLFNLMKNEDDAVICKTCGSSFITRRHVITAAHCLKHKDWFISQYVVLSSEEINVQYMDLDEHNKVSDVYVLKGWRFPEGVEDHFRQEIGVAKLEKELTVTEYPSLKVLRLPEKGMDFKDKVGMVIGMGKNTLGYDNDNELSREHGTNDYKLRFTKYRTLNEFDTSIFKKLKCDRDYKLCGYPEDGKYKETFGTLSEGDSGSGLVYDKDTLIGVHVGANYFHDIYYFSSTSFHKELIDRMTSDDFDPDEIEKYTYS